MSGESKDKLPASGRPMIAQPQATWPMPANMTDFPAWQWQPVNWQQMAAMAYSGMSYLHPGAGLPGVLHQPPMPAHTSVTVASTNPSPRAKDDSVKVVKPKDPQMRVASSSAGIQSPKPNGPGFLLGASTGGGFRAFSPYTSRSETPGSSPSVSGRISEPLNSAELIVHPQPITFDYYVIQEYQRRLKVGRDGVDLTKGKKSSSIPSAVSTTGDTTNDKRDDKPVGIVNARQRSASDRKSRTSQSVPSPAVAASAPGVVSTTTSTATPATTTITSTPHQPVVTTVGGQWPPFPAAIPYLGTPFHHFTLAQHPLYMMPPRAMFPGQPGVPAPPGYVPMPAQQMLVPDQLTVKTQVPHHITAHASTSPSKPYSAEPSPKSPLDKFREKYNEKNQKNKEISSKPSSPTGNQTKYASSDVNEKTGDDISKPQQMSVIIANSQAKGTPGSDQPPLKKEKKDKIAKPAKIRKTMSLTADLTAPSADVASAPSPRAAPASSPRVAPPSLASPTLISPAKFHPQPAVCKSEEVKAAFIRPASPKVSKKSSPPEQQHRSSSTDAASVSEKPIKSIASGVSRHTSEESIKEILASIPQDKRLSRISTLKTSRIAAPSLSKRQREETAASDAVGADKPAKASNKSTRSSSTDSKMADKPPTLSKQVKSRKLKRKSSDSSVSKPEVETPIPIDVANKTFLWAEDAFDPIIVKHNDQVFDLCQEEDMKQFESKLKLRLKSITKQINSHQECVDGDTCALTLRRCLSSESHGLSSPSSPDKNKSCFSVRSDSHPSLKMKAAAKAKSRASQEEREGNTAADSAPASNKPSKEKPAKLMEPLTPILIPEQQLLCRGLTTEELLCTEGLILICIQGLFYECRIKPIEPPDLYGVLIDGERHSKSRIFTQEELLCNTFTNLIPMYLPQLDVGSRVCAYWSEVIGCLYPGTVTAICPSKVNSSKHLIDIEFDDGDSGKFPLHQIRMLPPDHPHVEYDTSTVIASGRRRSTIPETPPIMTTPPDHRGRVSQPNPPKGKVPTGATAKKVKKSKPSHLSRAEVFDESTDDEEPVVDDVTKISHWEWYGTPTKKLARGRGFKIYYEAITREGGDVIRVGDCAVFKSVGANTLPYIGEIQNMWEGAGGKMLVNVKWFYHPEELQDVKVSLPKHKGALFHSEHIDENDIQTIRHKCEVVEHGDFLKRKLHLRSGDDRMKFSAFYLAGNYNAAKSKIISVYV